MAGVITRAARGVPCRPNLAAQRGLEHLPAVVDELSHRQPIKRIFAVSARVCMCAAVAKRAHSGSNLFASCV
jgi:hypothetical protein